jgi:hypothetical protein
MLFLNINSDPEATIEQESLGNDILRNEFSPGVTNRGGFVKHTEEVPALQEAVPQGDDRSINKSTSEPPPLHKKLRNNEWNRSNSTKQEIGRPEVRKERDVKQGTGAT